jgi:phosphoglycerate dehydrogenase-like enzyme
MQPHPQPCVLVFEPENPAELPFYRRRLAESFPAIEVLTATNTEEALRICPPATGLLGKAHQLPSQLVKGMPRLDWIQALTTGVDNLLEMNLPGSVTLCSARGIHGPQMSELALLYMLALAREFPRMLVNQHQSRWERWPQRLLFGKTALIVGVGTISRVLALHCRGLGMKVIGISNAVTSAPNFDSVRPRAQLHAAAGHADFLILLVPYSPETHQLANASLFAAMKPGSFLINIARGRVTDEAALILALQSGQLAGAALDVFANEPLPPTSALWQLPNVIITPHIGGMSDCYAEQLMPLVEHNLRAYVTGDIAAMRNLVAR